MSGRWSRAGTKPWADPKTGRFRNRGWPSGTGSVGAGTDPESGLESAGKTGDVESGLESAAETSDVESGRIRRRCQCCQDGAGTEGSRRWDRLVSKTIVESELGPGLGPSVELFVQGGEAGYRMWGSSSLKIGCMVLSRRCAAIKKGSLDACVPYQWLTSWWTPISLGQT